MAITAPRLTPRLFDYWVTVYKRTWRGSAVTSFVMPFLYLTAMGVGLGSFVDDSSGGQGLGGSTYLAFIAPGLLAATAMQTSVGEAMWPVMSGFKWDKTYFSMSATPLTVADIVAAHLLSIAARTLISSAVFLGVLAMFGALQSWWGGPAAVAVAGLIGLAHSAPMFGVSARINEPTTFALIMRLGVMPMFLFSGAFFPISQLPDVISWLAFVTPIWHGVELTRMCTLGEPALLPALGHVAYLALWCVAGWFYAQTGFRNRLAQ